MTYTSPSGKAYPAFDPSGTLQGLPPPPDAAALGTNQNPNYVGVPDNWVPSAFPQSNVGGPTALQMRGSEHPFGPAGSTMMTQLGTPLHMNDKGGGTLYTTRDVFTPTLDPQSIPVLQLKLIQTGYLDPQQVRMGVWDGASQEAYRKVLTFANTYGAYVGDALNILQQYGAAQQQQSGPKGGQPGPYQVTNPADLKKAYRDAAESLIGKDLPASESEQFAAMYQQQERNAYSQLAQGISTQQAGGTQLMAGTQAPSATAAAEDYINTHHLADKIAYGAASRMQDFYGMLNAVTNLTPAQGQ